MTTAPSSGAPTVAPPLAALRAAAELADRITAPISDRETVVELDSVEYSGIIPLADAAAGDLLALASDGHSVDIRIRAGEWSLDLRRGDVDATNLSGPTAHAVGQSKIDALEAAIEGRDLTDILALLSAHNATIKIRVINDPYATGTHWLATHTRLSEILASRQWVPLARNLSTGPSALVIDDLGDAVLTNRNLTVHGPTADPGNPTVQSAADPATRDQTASADVKFRVDHAGQTNPYPSPNVFGPLAHEMGGAAPAIAAAIASVQRTFQDLAFLLAWALLANTRTPIEGGLHVTISGARELAIDIKPPPRGGAETDISSLLALYTWVALSPELDRLYFTQQALTLAVVNVDDIPSAAGPAYRTAQSLYELSRQKSVAEVMSSRRSAREIALAAARSAAAQAREASGKAIERVVVQSVAAAGLLVARFQANLPIALTVGLLILVMAICLASAYITEQLTLRSARDGLDHELDDLSQYRDSISEADLTTIREAGAVIAARNDLNRASTTAGFTYIATAIAAGIAAIVVGVIAAVDQDEPAKPPKIPAPTSSTSSPAGQIGNATTPTRSSNPVPSRRSEPTPTSSH